MTTSFASRRVRHILLTVVVVALMWLLWMALRISLRPHAVYTGFMLLLVVLALAAFNGRKKLPFLPLARASTWLQFHIYAGWLSVALFLAHTGPRVPTGLLETIVAGLFVTVVASGVLGLWITRVLPPLLTRSGESLVFERIPRYERELREQVEMIVEQAEIESGSTALGNFYLATLAPYFQHHSGVGLLLGPPGRHAQRISARMDEFARYLDTAQAAHMDRLRVCVDRKRNIDFQNAAQKLLKLWLFIHIPFSVSLIIAAFVHAWTALMHGGAF